jgi:hypothetical protein
MLVRERLSGDHRRLVEHSPIAHAIVYGVIAFIVIFGIDLIWHFGAIANWFWERATRAIVEAAIVAIIGGYLFHLREKRMLRRYREVQYLNHHIRNALSLITMGEQPLTGEQASAVRKATDRICSVLEQLSRGEEMSIDEEDPEKYNNAA